jgi:hypothetical protein
MMTGRLLTVSMRTVWVSFSLLAGNAAGQEVRDPAAWGNDHVGKPLPMYMTGDECLFCHRVDVGQTWQNNRHNAGMRHAAGASEILQEMLKDKPELIEITEQVLGGDRMKRILKPNGRYGQYAIHALRWHPDTGVLENADGDWDAELFANRCAGCHTTAVETEFKAFAAASLDCFVCHGDVPDGHQNRPELAHFSKARRLTPLVEMSICGQCHLRGGHSRSSGLPYPNQFVAGDNLFRDFEVDLSEERIATLGPAERHIFANVREVTILANEAMTCTSCHTIHGESTERHRSLDLAASAQYCAICHDNPGDLRSVVRFERHNAVCQY